MKDKRTWDGTEPVGMGWNRMGWNWQERENDEEIGAQLVWACGLMLSYLVGSVGSGSDPFGSSSSLPFCLVCLKPKPPGAVGAGGCRLLDCDQGHVSVLFCDRIGGDRIGKRSRTGGRDAGGGRYD